MYPMRLQKFLSAAGVCSRRKGETYIQAGRVTVGGVVVRELGAKVDPERDHIAVDGRTVTLPLDHVYLALNKPRGVVTSCRHPGEKTVVDLIDIQRRVFPIGRLDKDSTGLLLLTDDGALHHQLSHPSFDHEKQYIVTVVHPIPDGALQKLADGMPMMGTRTRPAEVVRLSARRFAVTLKEGRNRQIRRMVRKVGNRVARLERVRVADIELGDLRPGKWRYLTETEVAGLKRTRKDAKNRRDDPDL
jgi:23S rRNA pseudouridine2605 synthase/23S rRNA pseudouridine2604 synthase